MLTTMLVPAMKTEASETETVDVAIQENASNAYDELMSSFPAYKRRIRSTRGAKY